jgi:hypothetical protein
LLILVSGPGGVLVLPLGGGPVISPAAATADVTIATIPIDAAKILEPFIITHPCSLEELATHVQRRM